jgi:hypothetical protein
MFVLASLWVGILCWRLEHNFQDATAIGTFTLACSAIGLSALQAWLIIKQTKERLIEIPKAKR